MARIVSPIVPAAFELIRDRIGEILIDEIDQQGALTYEPLFDKTKVYTEHSNPIDKTEIPVVNVCWAGGLYDSKDYSGSVRANPYTYHVEVYTNAKTSSTKDGSYTSAKKLQMIMRVCRGILENPIYKTLGYQAPYIQRVFISEIKLAPPANLDGLNTSMGILVFNVVVAEQVDLLVPKLIAGYETTVKLGDSNSGYYYSS